MYSERVLKIFECPQRSGKITKADGIGEVSGGAGNDQIKIYLNIDEKEKIIDAKFQTFGCCGAIVCAETICNEIIGENVGDAMQITNKQIIERLGGLPDEKVYCAELAVETLLDAIANYRKKKSKK